MAGFIGSTNSFNFGSYNRGARFSNIGWSSSFPYNGSFRGSPGGFGFGNNFGSFGGAGLYGGFGNPYGFGGNIGGFGGGAAWGVLAASIVFAATSMIQAIITARQDGGGNEGHDCGCGDKNQDRRGHPDNHISYIDGPSEHRWEPDGYNVSFDVDYS